MRAPFAKKPSKLDASSIKAAASIATAPLAGAGFSNRIAGAKTASNVQTGIPMPVGPGGTSGAGVSAFAPLYKDLLYDNIGQYQTPKAKTMYNKLMRQIYHFDPICGPAVDLYAEMPWSTFDLSGIEDPSIVHIYEDALNNLKLDTYLPEISRNWLVHGRVCLHFLFDAGKGVWTNVIMHDDDDVRIIPVPLLNEDPLVELVPSPTMRQFVMEDDPRIRPYLQKLPQDVIEKIKKGRPIPLDNSNTLYLPRKTVTNDMIGTSLYSRIIGLVTLERALFNASVSRAQRSAGTIRVVKIGRAGDQGWLPTDEEVNAAITSIMMAEEDPTGSAIGFKTQDINIDAIAGSAADNLWKISDEADYIEKAKFKALGINEAMMSGDATFNNMEQALSIMLEKIKMHRALLERKIIIERVLEPLAKAHGFFKKKTNTAGYNRRSDKVVIRESDDSQLILPSIQWSKPLEPRMDQSIVDLYDKAEEVGLSIPLRRWATVLGLNATELEAQAEDDLKLRTKFADIKKRRDEIGQPLMGDEGGGGDDFGDLGGDESGSGGDLGGGGGPDDLEEPGGSEEEGPSMEKVEPSSDSVVDKIPPPPKSSTINILQILQNHPLMSKKGFGALSTTKLMVIASLNDKQRLEMLKDWTPAERALAKYAVAPLGSKLKLAQAEVAYLRNQLKGKKLSLTQDLKLSVDLIAAGEDPGRDLLTGVQ